MNRHTPSLSTLSLPTHAKIPSLQHVCLERFSSTRLVSWIVQQQLQCRLWTLEFKWPFRTRVCKLHYEEPAGKWLCMGWDGGGYCCLPVTLEKWMHSIEISGGPVCGLMLICLSSLLPITLAVPQPIGGARPLSFCCCKPNILENCGERGGEVEGVLQIILKKLFLFFVNL